MKKKWIIVLVVIIVLAVVLTIVFINLFTPKHTTELSNQVNSITQTGYLNKNNTNNLAIDAFMTEQQTNELLSSKEKRQIENYLKTFEAFEVMGEFYNRQLVFSKYTNVYDSNKKPIINSLKNANKLAGEIAEYFANKPDDSQYRAEAWKTKANAVKTMFNETVNAFTRLSAVYTSCVNSKMMNNEMSQAIFKVTNYLLSTVKNDLESEEAPTDVKGQEFLDFVNTYYTKGSVYQITNIHYDSVALLIAKEIVEEKDLEKYSTESQSNWNWFVKGQLYTLPVSSSTMSPLSEEAA